MRLFERVRLTNAIAQNNEGAYHQNRLNIIISAGQAEAAAVLFRTIALTALTFRENANHNRPNDINIPESQKVFPVNDCLIIFGQAADNPPPPPLLNPAPFMTFPNLTVDGTSILIANSELEVVNKTIQDYRIFLNDNQAGRNNNGWPGPLQNWNLPVLNREVIFNNYNAAAGNAATAQNLNPNANNPVTSVTFQNILLLFSTK